jgi:hypothetical protein
LLLLGLLVAVKREKTLLGESFLAVVLSFASVPVGLACGVPIAVALIAAAVWATGFLLSTATVHAILARSKRGAVAPATAVGVIALLVIGGSVAAIVLDGPRWTAALIPAAFVSLGVIASRLPTKKVRTLGWMLVVADIATAAILLSAFWT